MLPTINNQKGYIALIAVVIVLVVTLAISVTLNILSIDETRAGLLKQQSAQSAGLADSCLQEAYLRLKGNPGYTAGNLNTATGSCTMTVEDLGQNERLITVASDASGIVRQLQSKVKLTGPLVQVNYWREIF